MSDVEKIRFGHPMRVWQREVALKTAAFRFAVLALHRRAGKTEIALKKLLDCAVKNQLDSPLYFYLAPLLKQAKVIAWSRLKQMVMPLQNYGAVEINESELMIRFPHNSAVIRLYGGDNPEAMRGVRLDGIVIDETAQIKKEVWEEIIQPALSDRLGWAWFIGTPHGINLFSQLFFGASTLVDWIALRYTVYETNALNMQEVERLRLSMSEETFAREFLCDFSAAGDDQIISLTDAEQAAQRIHPIGSNDYAPLILGVDPARFGPDRTVLMPRQGLIAMEPIILQGADQMKVAGRVARFIEERKPDATMIDVGMGQGVIDRLRQLGYDVMEVNFGSKSADPQFLNKRGEMWFSMRDWIRAGGAIPNDMGLKIELSTPTYKFDPANRIVVESKDDIKRRLPGGNSPDLADALAITFAYSVYKKQPFQPDPGKDRRDYNPYSGI
jgi:hypothetical protein